MTKAAKLALPYTPEDLALIPRVLPGLNILRILTISSNCRRDEILDQHPDLQMTVGLENKVTANINYEKKQVWAYLDMALTAASTSAEFQDKVPFKIEARLEVRYQMGQSDLTEDEFKRALQAFCHTTSPMHGWSFFRQFVVDAMSRMMLTPILLPLLLPVNPQPAPQPEPPPGKRARHPRANKA